MSESKFPPRARSRLPVTATREQTRTGQAASLALRRSRAEVKAQLKSGVLDIYNAWGLEEVQGMKVGDLLLALPRIGQIKARIILEKAGIPRGNTVRRCGPKQVERLFGALR